MKNKILWAILITAGLMLVSCSRVASTEEGTEGGSSSEVVAGRILKPDGKPAKNANIYVYEANFLAKRRADTNYRDPFTTSNEEGEYGLKLDSGNYKIEFEAPDNLGLIISLDYSGGPLEISDQTLMITGSLSGVINTNSHSDSIYVHVSGTDRIQLINPKTHIFNFYNLPPGKYILHFSTIIDSITTMKDVEDVIIISDSLTLIEPIIWGLDTSHHVDSLIPIDTSMSLDTIPVSIDSIVDSSNTSDVDSTIEIPQLVTYSEWNYKAQVTINTKYQGLALTQTLSNYPLLIRLRNENFNFGQAHAEGYDIRFTDSAGTALAYELEHWNATDGYASIWILVDSIYHDNDSQYIYMFWGNGDASDSSSGSSVFNQNNGYVGVWHLKENKKTMEDPAKFENATGFTENAWRNSISRSKLGYIGCGEYFEIGDYIKIRNAPDELKPKYLTISSWIKLGSDPTNGGTIASMGDNYGLRIERSGHPWFFINSSADSNIHSGPYAQDTENHINHGYWTQVTGVFSGYSLKIFINGIFTEYLATTDAISYSLGEHFFLGNHGNHGSGYEFKGHMDEVRISSQSRSRSWITFTYEHQKNNLEMLTIQPLVNH